MIRTDTCAALSTAPGKAGIAVIRISGASAFEIASNVFFPASKKKLSQIPRNTAVYGEILCGGRKIDEGLCVCFHAPHSYTGENTVEISSHGSEIGVSLILSALFEAGAHPAEPGEFTKRAFLNGKLTLTQAEAVAELIDAQSEASLVLFAAQAGGKLREKIDEIGQRITNILSAIYAYIDYPDEDLADMSGEEMRGQLLPVRAELEGLLMTYDTGLAIARGIPAAIIGLPNTGKSSFLNLLTGKDRAIVTEIAGTTRDIVTEDVSVGNLRLRLSDTAGIRKTKDPVEQIGVRRAYAEMERAQVIFALFDRSKPLTDEDTALIKALGGGNKQVVILLNKSDLPPMVNEKAFCGFKDVLHFSAKTGEGLEQLSETLKRKYPYGDREIKNGLILVSARQRAALKNALLAVAEALQTLERFTADVAGTDLERALAFLYETDGRRVSEEVVNGIFERFCVGK